MPPLDEDDFLRKARIRILTLLIKRIRTLHFSQPPPTGYYVGQRYVEDTHKVDCVIGANFIFPAQVSPFEFWLHGTRITGTQHDNVLVIMAYKRIARQLWEDVKYIGVGHQFIVGYLVSYMPRINRILIDNRYNQGHLLSNNFSGTRLDKVAARLRSLPAKRTNCATS
jgi:hypothetical protein